MNKDSANTMLKFLEEPNGNVIGFFITNERDNVMLTIQSRCEIIEALFSNTDNERLNIDEEEYTELLHLTQDYTNKIEMEKRKLILYNKLCLSDLEKDKIIIILKIMLKGYNEVLNNKILNIPSNNGFSFLEKFSVKNLKKKVDLLTQTLQEINYNVNLDLFLDRFILKVDDINNETL